MPFMPTVFIGAKIAIDAFYPLAAASEQEPHVTHPVAPATGKPRSAFAAVFLGPGK